MERIEEVGGRDNAGGIGIAKEFGMMKLDIVAKDEGIGLSVGRNDPPLGNTGLGLKMFVEADESVVNLAAPPDDGLVFGKCGVEGGDAGRLVVSKYLFVAIVGDGA